MSRTSFVEMGGYDERFTSPGGGLVNHDFLGRVLARPDIRPVVILGEGSFHQIHGGVATNVPPEEYPWESFKAEYQRIHNEPFEYVKPVPAYYLGEMHGAAKNFVGMLE